MAPRLLPLMLGVLLVASALVACRKEVPTPPVPAPDKPPLPVTRAAEATGGWRLTPHPLPAPPAAVRARPS